MAVVVLVLVLLLLLVAAVGEARLDAAQAWRVAEVAVDHSLLGEVVVRGVLGVVTLGLRDRCTKAVKAVGMRREVEEATMEVVAAGAEVVVVAIVVQEVGDLVMWAAVRTLEVPRCCKAPRGPAPVQCRPRSLLSPATCLGWVSARRGRTQ